MKVLFVAAECVPFIKTGGLADVAGSLPKALAGAGVDVRVVLPAYGDIKGLVADGREVARHGELFGGPARIVLTEAEGLTLLLIDAPHLFDRPGNPYVMPDGNDWPDNHLRFAALAWASADLAVSGADGWQPDVVHCHDWHAGLTPLYLRQAEAGRPPSMISIHNILYQGLFPADVRHQIGLEDAGFVPDGYEFHGQVGFLKAGLIYADRVATVSPTYAKELLSSEFGYGLEGVLAYRGADFVGILNGIDTDIWNPADDPLIAGHYKAPNKKAKAVNRRALEARFGLEPEPGQPLFCVISRLTEQKGLDLLLDALPALVEAGARLVVLGTGDKAMEESYREAAQRFPGRVAVTIGYDEALAHMMQAGADAIVIPSRFEPCGLTQLCGMRYGCVPVVSVTGGLADTVIDADAELSRGTGFCFQPVTVDALVDALRRAVACYHDEMTWRSVVRRAMRRPVGWDAQAKIYRTTYEAMVAQARVGA